MYVMPEQSIDQKTFPFSMEHTELFPAHWDKYSDY